MPPRQISTSAGIPRGHVAADNLVASAAYQPEPTAAAAARRFVRDTLQGWVVTGDASDGHGLVDDAVLLTSELVTNAVVHAGTAVNVTCRLVNGAVEVVVSDGHPARLVPEPAAGEHGATERTSGRGLLLPAAMASAWGVTYGRAAKAVWFRLGLTGPGAGAGSGGEQGVGLRLHGELDAVLDGGAALSAAFRSAQTGTGAGLAGAGPDGSRAAGAGAAGAGAASAGAAGVRPPADGGFESLLAAAVESARAAVNADAAFALMADEDGDLRLRAAAGDLPPLDGPAGNGFRRGSAGAQAASPRGPGLPRPSLMTVPFVVDGRVTGLLSAASATPGRFTDADTARLQRLADAAGPRLQRAWLAGLDTIRRRRISALADARGLLSGTMGQDEILATVGRATVPRLAPWCAVLLRSDSGGLRAASAVHADAARAEALHWLMERVCEAATDAAPWQQPADGAGLRWPPVLPPDSGAPAGAAAFADEAAWCFPLGGAGGWEGALIIGNGQEERLPREVAALAADLASRTGVALANARLVSPQN
jgi:anti-sigma regulatory factor (Ser/Thr protein kinase)